ncbi:arylsulfatase [Halomonas binhaiensis]|uniref:Arylsulfatase n=1 Tax=Halomonas binhaiensis TaxID=2562282 RepID=A0A856QV08_9GAMM|nr:arylsulfatase [Halomonas binhaiensis]QEM83852.2 arylsulfatase [Halomonas binhaiensis]
MITKAQSGAAIVAGLLVMGQAMAQEQEATDEHTSYPTYGTKPNIVLIVSDDTGYWDLGAYLGGKARGMDTPNLDRMADEGMMFTDFYAQASCTPGRAAMQTGRNPNRSGMTTVAFQGQGGGLPEEEWTLASVLKQADYNTYFSGKWHLGEADYAMPIAQGYDKMENVLLYHLNAMTYALDGWNPQISEEQRKFFEDSTIGILEGEAGEKPTEVLSMADMTEKDLANLDTMTAEKAVAEMERLAGLDQPFFMSINWSANHQPNLPADEFVGASDVKSKYGDKVVEMDAQTGKLLDKIKELGIEDNTLIVYTVDNGAWQDVHPDSGMTPFRGSKGTDREGGWRVPAIFKWKGHIDSGARSSEIAGGLDLMATFAHLAGVELPKEDRAGEPIIFDSYDMAPILFSDVDDELWKRDSWLYFTETELMPGAIRIGHWKAVFNQKGDNGAIAGSEAPAAELGWRGPSQYSDVVPQIFNLWEDPQERYDIFMASGRENTWALPFFSEELKKVAESYMEYPPRPLQSDAYSGPLTIKRFRALEKVQEILKEKNIQVDLSN